MFQLVKLENPQQLGLNKIFMVASPPLHLAKIRKRIKTDLFPFQSCISDLPLLCPW